MRFVTRHHLSGGALLSRRRVSTVAKRQISVPSGIEGKYASALYQVACETNFAQIVKEMEAAKKAILSDPNLLETLETPILSSEKKKTALYKTLKLNAASVQSKNFFDLLADNRRLSYTAKILNVFEELVMKHNDLTVIEIVSAEELSPQIINRIVTAVKKIKHFCPTNNVEIKNRADPSILGGFIVNVDDKSIDLSAISKVNQLSKIFTETL